MDELNIKILFLICLMSLGCGMTLKRHPPQIPENRGTVNETSSLKEANEIQPEKWEGKENQLHPEGLEGKKEELETAEPLKVGIILGPGGVRSFAHTGVIRELLNAQIPIDSVVGMEWGALVGGMFANKGQIHDTEWKLYKLQKKELLEKKSFFGSKADFIGVGQLKEFTDKNFGTINFAQMQIDFACPTLSVRSGTIQWQNRGLLKKAINRCWPYPPIFKPKEAWVAAAFALPEAVEYLKSHGMELIIFVNVMDVGDLLTAGQLTTDYKSSILWQEIRRSLQDTNDLGIEVIHVKTRRFKLYDFNSRQSLVMAGEQAGKRAADALVQKYGF